MDPDDLSYALPRHLYYQVVHALRLALPPPASDHPDDLLHRDRAAIAQVAAMLPANAEEAMLAAQVVAAGAQALDCFRLLRRHEADVATGFKCTAQAASMMRQGNAARSLLMRLQAAREKREAHHQRCDAAASIEHCAIGLMSDAVEAMPSAATPSNTARHSNAAPVANRSRSRPAGPAPVTPVPDGSAAPQIARAPADAQDNPLALRVTSESALPCRDDAGAPEAGPAPATAPVSAPTASGLLARPAGMAPPVHHRPVLAPSSKTANHPAPDATPRRYEDEQTTPCSVSRPARWARLARHPRDPSKQAPPDPGSGLTVNSGTACVSAVA